MQDPKRHPGGRKLGGMKDKIVSKVMFSAIILPTFQFCIYF